MKILAVADEESKYLWDYFRPEKLKDIDLIVGCGDLNSEYVNFLATMAHVPVLYIHGNHDEYYDRRPPTGAISIDDELYTYRGVRFVGLGGCLRYRQGLWQYTEAEMKKRIRRLRGAIDRAGGFDVLVTHAPLHGYGDFSDLPHRGFGAFRELLDEYKPAVMVHGHIHLTYGPNIPREQRYGDTRIINACERFVFEVPDRAAPAAPARRGTRLLRFLGVFEAGGNG